ncbi:MAG: Lrp/AsnC ligand binding domain-containing protein [Nanopusillaceae archaeon]
MIEAYILINLKPGKEKEFIEFVRRELHNMILDLAIVYGEYDSILKVRVESFDKLRNTLIDKLRKLDYVERTITLIVAS